MHFQGFLHEAWVKIPVLDNNITDINEETDIRVAFFLSKRCWSVECMTWLLEKRVFRQLCALPRVWPRHPAGNQSLSTIMTPQSGL